MLWGKQLILHPYMIYMTKSQNQAQWWRQQSHGQASPINGGQRLAPPPLAVMPQRIGCKLRLSHALQEFRSFRRLENC
jgi:hypothetical protein